VKYRIIIEQDEDGMYIAECPTLPGCISQGKTREEALVDIKDAVKKLLEKLAKANKPILSSISQDLTFIYGLFIIMLDYTHRLRYGEGGEYTQEGWLKVNPPFLRQRRRNEASSHLYRWEQSVL
jgi:predicted RNase H-like HicB family nuclease